MAQISNNDLPVNMRLKAIELINSSLKQPENGNQSISNFDFNLSIESKIDAPKKLVFTIVHVEVKNDDQIFGSVSVSCIFEILDFDEVVTIDPKGKPVIPTILLQTLHTISISTTRGVMFSTFKGTFLHGAVLPIIDSKDFTIET
jgi:hypothetical protein